MYQFDSPIVSIWRENANRDSEDQDLLEEISLFNSSQWIWGPEYSTSSPGLYVGMHERQLYVQENSKLKTSLDSYKHVQPAVYPWQPYPAKGMKKIKFSYIFYFHIQGLMIKTEFFANFN